MGHITRGAVLAALALFVACDEPARAGYFSVRPDLRRCISPLCGGFWFKAVNQKLTRCFDGSEAAECYAGDIDWRRLSLSEEQAEYAWSRAAQSRLVVKGQFADGTWPDFKQVPRFVASEAWDAATDNPPQGTFYFAQREPIVCVRYPCDDISATQLNVPDSTSLFAGIDFSATGASASQVQEAYKRLETEGLVLAAFAETGPSEARLLDAQQYYVKLAHGPSCQPSGCSGEICAPAGSPVATPCVWRPEFACYQRFGKCELQSTVSCGWTPTPELQACLDDVGAAAR
ncbi:MAG TPA: DUF6748 domain-containing protein [Polyangiaceae bacterium]